MFIVTGGAGFIGSAVIAKLNASGIDDILVVDNIGTSEKWKNLVGKQILDYEHKDSFIEEITKGNFNEKVDCIIHMGACSSTTERNADYMMRNNFHYSMLLAKWAIERKTRFIYASSAATYGDGAFGFSDNDEVTPKLKPLNIYGYSKLLFDMWAIKSHAINHITGLRFFNVYGPNEYHKDDMASVVFKAFNSINKSGSINLFKSHRIDFQDGEQCRDFIYVKDCTDVIWQLVQKPNVTGIFNLGSGQAQTWNQLAKSVFTALGTPPKIEYIDMPESIREKYQYFTQAPIDKLKKHGISVPSTTLQDGVADYVTKYLANNYYHY